MTRRPPRTHRWPLVGVAVLLASLAASALAQTGPDCRLDSPAAVTLERYRPDSAPTASAWTLRVRSTRGCVARLQIEGLSEPGRLLLAGPAATGDRLALSISGQPSGTEPVAAAPVDAASITVGTQQDQTLRLWLRPEPGQWLAAGNWQHTVLARLIDAQGRTLDTREVRISAQVDATVRAQFSDTAGGSQLARLDFGLLQQGARRSTTLDVQANTPHSVVLESAQRGHLTNARAPQSPAIAWTLRINGQTVGLATAARLPFAAGGRQRHVLEAEIGSVERVLAGEYRDELQITITAQ